MTQIPIIVIGAGHLGRYHLQKLIANEQADLLGAVEVNPDRAAEIKKEFSIECHPSIDAFAGKARAAVIATPTNTHKEIAIAAITHGMDVLIEKPIAPNTADAQAILDVASQFDKLVQVGHTERFNPAVAAALPIASNPRYITAERLAPFTGRSTDVDVILDLLIHDLDIVASLIPSPVKEVRAIGVPILTNAIDMCSARIEFEDGAVAELKAGRASLEPSRKIRLITNERYISIDCDSKEVKSVRRLAPAQGSEWPQIQGETIEVQDLDALEAQDASFLECVASRSTPVVSGADGLRAVKIAQAIKDVMTSPYT